MAQIPPREVSTSDKRAAQEPRAASSAPSSSGRTRRSRSSSSAIKLSRAGLRAPEKPIGSFLLTGPTGVGKTEVAKQLAKVAGHRVSPLRHERVHGARTPSRASSARRPATSASTRAASSPRRSRRRRTPCSCSTRSRRRTRDVFNVLLQVMDHGTLTDNNGKTTDFRHVVLLMTSNVGARDLQRRAVGFGGARRRRPREARIDREYKKLFSPEFRNRLDARIAFRALDPKVMGSIVDKFMRELGEQLAPRGVTIALTEAPGLPRGEGLRPGQRRAPARARHPGRGEAPARRRAPLRRARERRPRRGRRQGRRAHVRLRGGVVVKHPPSPASLDTRARSRDNGVRVTAAKAQRP